MSRIFWAAAIGDEILVRFTSSEARICKTAGIQLAVQVTLQKSM